jgi:3-oxoacyl-(acyl-carrier-protein) synthase/NAD(P)-dependent dehydrogenase (short-subunit alcohol dehydrogenase family)
VENGEVAPLDPSHPSRFHDFETASTQDDVAIIGMGSIFAGATTLEAFWELLTSGRDPKVNVPLDRWNPEVAGRHGRRLTTRQGGFITDFVFDWKKHKIPPKQIANANPLQFLLLDAVDQAFTNAGFDHRKLDRSRVGTVVGTLFGGDFSTDTFLGVRLAEFQRTLSQTLARHDVPEDLAAQISAAYADAFLTCKPAARDETASLSSSTLASRISKAFDLMGGAFSIDVGNASALAAVSASVDLLKSGTCNIVVCAAGQRSMDLTAYESFGLAERLTDDDPQAPLDVNAIGFVPGEGVGVVLLKRLSEARRDGDRIHAIIRGIATATDSTSMEQAVRSAIEGALDSAGITADQIGVIETGAIGVPRLDDAEAKAIEAVYGTTAVRHPILIGSPASQIGNTQGASGMASLLKTTLALKHGRIPATTSPIYATTANSACIAGVTSLTDGGFASQGGSAYHLLLEGGTGLPQPQSSDDQSSDDRASDDRASDHRASDHPKSQRTERQQSKSQQNEIVGRNMFHVSDASIEEIEAFVIDFVVEQTGFPPELIELDDEMESFFGIDGTRKAQMLAELEARCEFTDSKADLSPKNCSSLRQVIDSLRNSRSSESADKPREQLAVSPVAELPPREDSRSMSRFVMRTVDVPLVDDASHTLLWNGPAIILGRNAAAEALRERLGQLNVAVYELPVDEDSNQTLAELNRIWEQAPAPHLFLMTARDEDASVEVDDEAGWNRRRERGVMLPFRVCQRWFELLEADNLLDKASLVAATALGGDFGLSGHCPAVEGGGIAGLLKALDVETRGKLLVKVIDAPPREPVKLIANAICRELAAATADVEVGYVRGRRQALRAIPQQAATLPRREIERESVWVVTGGARGITAYLARELGCRFNLKLHLLGTSPLPTIDESWRSHSDDERKQFKAQVVREALNAGESPQQAWSRIEKAIEMDQMLREYERSGVDFTYHQCDVSDRRGLAAVLERVRQADGPIAGVIHGAGIEAACKFQKKQLETVSRVLAAKVDGAAALMALTREDPLKFFVGFSSTSGRFGGYIQTDYSMANDMLSKLINAYRDQRPECAAFSIHWTAFDDVGMGVRPSSRFVLDAMRVNPMSPSEGAEHLIDELQAQTRETEILITDHPHGVHSNHVTMPTSEQMSVSGSRRSDIANTPLIDSVYVSGPETGIAYATFDPTSDPFLLGHLDEGVPLFPAVMGIETCAQAAAVLSEARYVVGLRDVKIVNGFRMAEMKPHRATVRVTRTGNEAVCQLSGEFYDKQGRFTDPNRLYLTCIVELADAPRDLETVELGDLPSQWIEVPYPDNWRDMQDADSGTVYYGPQLRSLKQVHHQPDGAWGRLVAPAPSELGGSRLGTAWQTPPALLDALLFGCDLFASETFGTRQLPQVIDRIDFARPPKPSEHCISRTLYHGRSGRQLSWDFWVIGDDGTLILHCQGCHFVDLNYSLKDAVSAKATKP